MKAEKIIITDGRVILIDEHLTVNARTGLLKLKTTDGQELLFLEDWQLTIDMEEILAEMLKQDCRALLVFPGNGSNYPRKLSQICQNFPTTTSVYAKRFWIPGTDPEVQVGLIYPERFMVLGVKNIVVVDDVISSGLTMRKIYQKNAWRFPGTNWRACAWVSQALSSNHGYQEIEVSSMVRRNKNTQKVPINSLSTLRANSEIAKSYAYRHFREPQKFLYLIRKNNG